MGFHFRKSTKIGPFRLNFSDKGMGWSFGAGHARVGVTATGKKYASASGGGFYYRENLSRGSNNKDTQNIKSERTNNKDIKINSFQDFLILVGLFAFFFSPILALIVGSWTILFVTAGCGVLITLIGFSAAIITTKPDTEVKSDKLELSKNNESATADKTDLKAKDEDIKISLSTPVSDEGIQNHQEQETSINEEPIEDVTGCIRYEWNIGDDTSFLIYLPEEYSNKAMRNHYVYIPQQIWDEALQKYNESKEHDRQLSETNTNNNLGIQYEKDGDLDRAIEAYEKNLKIGYKATHAYDRLLVIYNKLNRTEDEIRVARLAVDMFPTEYSYQKRLNKLTGHEEEIVLPVQAVVSHPRIIHGELFEDTILKLPEFDFYNEESKHCNQVSMETLKPVHEIMWHFRDLITSAKTEDDHNNFAGSAAIYEQIIAEKYWATEPYDRLIKIYSKAKLKNDEMRVLKLAIEHFKKLKEKRFDYVQSLAVKYGAQAFFEDRVKTGKKITYYSGVFELYNPFTIIEKWEARLAKLNK